MDKETMPNTDDVAGGAVWEYIDSDGNLSVPLTNAGFIRGFQSGWIKYDSRVRSTDPDGWIAIDDIRRITIHAQLNAIPYGGVVRWQRSHDNKHIRPNNAGFSAPLASIVCFANSDFPRDVPSKIRYSRDNLIAGGAMLGLVLLVVVLTFIESRPPSEVKSEATSQTTPIQLGEASNRVDIQWPMEAQKQIPPTEAPAPESSLEDSEEDPAKFESVDVQNKDPIKETGSNEGETGPSFNDSDELLFALCATTSQEFRLDHGGREPWLKQVDRERVIAATRAALSCDRSDFKNAAVKKAAAFAAEEAADKLIKDVVDTVNNPVKWMKEAESVVSAIGREVLEGEGVALKEYASRSRGGLLEAAFKYQISEDLRRRADGLRRRAWNTLFPAICKSIEGPNPAPIIQIEMRESSGLRTLSVVGLTGDLCIISVVASDIMGNESSETYHIPQGSTGRARLMGELAFVPMNTVSIKTRFLVRGCKSREVTQVFQSVIESEIANKVKEVRSLYSHNDFREAYELSEKLEPIATPGTEAHKIFAEVLHQFRPFIVSFETLQRRLKSGVVLKGTWRYGEVTGPIQLLFRHDPGAELNARPLDNYEGTFELVVNATNGFTEDIGRTLKGTIGGNISTNTHTLVLRLRPQGLLTGIVPNSLPRSPDRRIPSKKGSLDHLLYEDFSGLDLSYKDEVFRAETKSGYVVEVKFAQ